MKEWKIGCSGFYNKHWKRIFYPEKLPQSKWFEFYSTQLNSLELNVTFYRFPTKETFKKWYDSSPADFLFSVKAPRIITHFNKFKDCERLLNDFYTACEKGLKEKLGCILFQMPPSFKYSEENLVLLVKSLNKNFINVAEFRDAGWWNKTVYDAFSKEKIVFCSANHPKLPDKLIFNSETAYIRMHGNPELFYSKYSENEIKNLYETVNKKRKVKEAYIYFNNTASTAGVENAIQLQDLIKN